LTGFSAAQDEHRRPLFEGISADRHHSKPTTMETFSLACKNCGAPLTVAKSARVSVCNHCGSKFGIKPTKREPEIVILEKAKPPIHRESVTAEIIPDEKPYDPADRREEREADQVRLARHGANLLNAVTGYRSCLNSIMVILILGCFVVCGFCGLPAILRFGAQAPIGGPTRVVTAREDRTERLLDTAARDIKTYARSSQVLPSADQGNEIIGRYRDEWDHAFRYEQNSARNFVIRSAGPDGEFDTEDDSTEREYSSSVRNASQSAPPPTDVASAIVGIQTPGLFQKNCRTPMAKRAGA
jgi:DNA-directed RNA polymerase subunit RPC12/RpoP